jgi:hypothetical protein
MFPQRESFTISRVPLRNRRRELGIFPQINSELMPDLDNFLIIINRCHMSKIKCSNKILMRLVTTAV